jgi:hypothetical protein
VLDAAGKVLAFGLALGTIGKVGNFGLKVVAGSLQNIGKIVAAIVPAPVLASVKSGLETIALKGMYAFDKVKQGAIDTAKAIAKDMGSALKEGGTKLLDFGKAAGIAAKEGLSKLLTNLGKLSMFFVTSPIGIAILAITVLAGLFILLYKNSETFREAVQKAFEKVKEGASMALEWIKTNWPLILAILTGPIGLLVLAVVKNFDEIVAFVKGIPTKLKDAAVGMWTWITGSLSSAYTAVQTKFVEIIAYIKTIPGKIGNGLSNIWSGLTDGLKTAWANAKAWWNANVASKKLKIGGQTVFNQTLPSFTLGFPQLAQGGIVPATPGGTIARIGEAGRPERVEPLDPQGLSKRDRAMIQMLAGGSGAGATINVYPSQGMNESELASIISRQIAFQLRRGGA